jgi:hypothetical protein
MEIVGSSETLVRTYEITLSHNPRRSQSKWTELNWLRISPIAGICNDGNEPADSILAGSVLNKCIHTIMGVTSTQDVYINSNWLYIYIYIIPRMHNFSGSWLTPDQILMTNLISIFLGHYLWTLSTSLFEKFTVCSLYSYTQILEYLIRSSMCKFESRDSSVGIATGYGLNARVRFPAVKDFSLLHSIQTDSGAHPASYPMGTGGSFPGGKAGEAWSWPLASI